MTHAWHRLSLLALGILAPVLAFGAIALSAAPSAEAIEEEPYVSETWTDCSAIAYTQGCGDEGCWTSLTYLCDDGMRKDVQSVPTYECDIGIADFDYCQQG